MTPTPWHGELMEMSSLEYQSATVLCLLIAGGAGAGPVLIVPAAVQPQRARFPGHLHAGRDARDQGMRRPGRHQRLHVHSLHGYAFHPHR